jgi:hypothetical protein
VFRVVRLPGAKKATTLFKRVPLVERVFDHTAKFRAPDIALFFAWNHEGFRAPEVGKGADQ